MNRERQCLYSPKLSYDIACLADAAMARLAISLRTTNADIILERDAERIQSAASIIKVPILLALLEHVAAGDFDLAERLCLDTVERVGGTGILAHLPNVTHLSVAELARLMIVLSDNVATNRLIDWLGFERINAWCQQAGLLHTCLQRRMMDFVARDAGMDNVMSARDGALALCWLHRPDSLPPTLRAFAFDLLSTQSDQTLLGATLPQGVKIANKTGRLPDVRNDTALLTLGRSCVVLSVFADHFADEQTASSMIGGSGERLLARLAKIVAQALVSDFVARKG